jgi:NAD(P)-dependent dehydrogenase (short-subunit alcohol dehydrogenase family)
MGKVMIVTGASRGIGAATAKLAARQGYAVCVNYANSKAEAEEVVADIVKGGGKAVAIQADVSKDADVKRLFKEVDEKLGTVTALVNNAGIIVRMCRADAMDEELLQKIFAANTFSVFYCNREAIRRMSTRHGGKGGSIVTVSSAAARHGGLPEETHYAASKGALDSLVVGLAKEIGLEGVRVTGIRPGLITTEIHNAHGGKALLDKVGPTVPIGRAGTPEEIAEAILWLASDSASYVHGTVIDVTGGR